MRRRIDHVRWTLRWHLKQRRPRPVRPLHLVDLVAESALCVLLVLFIATLEGIRL